MPGGGVEAVWRPSPNHGERRGGRPIDIALIHYTAMESAEAAIERLSDPAAEVSAHYVIAEDGRLFHLVAEARRAWHAGRAQWGGEADVNSRSVGIELANRGEEPFAAPQMRVLEALLSGLMERHPIRPERVLGHACVAPGRKIDPGPRFDWRRLAGQGLSIWLDPGARGEEPSKTGAAPGQSSERAHPPTPRAELRPERGPEPEAERARAFRAAACRFGYELEETGGWDDGALAVWQAFGARFRPAEAGAGPTEAGIAHLERLAALWPAAG